MKTIVNAALVAALVSVGASASAQSGGWDITYTPNLITEGSAEVISLNGASNVIYSYSSLPRAKVSGRVKATISWIGTLVPKRYSYVAEAVSKKTVNGFTSEGVHREAQDGLMSPGGITVLSPYFNEMVLKSSNPRNSVECQYDVKMRSVQISRPNVRYFWIGEDNLVHSDTIYSTKVLNRMIGGSIDQNSATIQWNWINFYAGRWGYWLDQNSYSFNWTPQFSGATKDWNTNQMPESGTIQVNTIHWPFNKFDKYIGTPKPKEDRTIHYRYNDTYGGAEEDQILHIHEIYEEIEKVYDFRFTMGEPPTPVTITGPRIAGETSVAFTWHLGGDWSLSTGFPVGWLGFEIGVTQAAVEHTQSFNCPDLTQYEKAVLRSQKNVNHWDYYHRKYDTAGEIPASPPLLKHVEYADEPAGTEPKWDIMPINSDPGGGPM